MRLLFFFLLIFNFQALCGNEEFIVISNIDVIGNTKTKTSIILRELDISIGDTIFVSDVEKKIQKNKNKIINLNLFLNVSLSLVNCDPPFVELQIYIAEQSYLLPFPIFRLADRSFNEWWYNRNHNFNRVIYGINFVHYNVGGRAKEFLINLENGFTKQLALVYKIPYINTKMKTGMEFSLIYNTNKQIAYRTFHDKLVFERSDENILLNKFNMRFVLKRRDSFYERQRIELIYNNEKAADSISVLNPNYFLHGFNRLRYFKATYVFEGDHRDNIIYPSKGHYFIGKISRFGILKSDNIKQNELYLSYAYFMKFKNRWFADFNFRTKITGPRLQPFSTSTAFGYKNDNIRGYDLYVIDGQKFGLFKSNIRKQFIETTIKISPFGFFKNAPTLPLSIYGRAFYDAGYVRNKNFQLNNSLLANKLISGFGFGLDIVSIYSGVLKASYSFNNLGEKGLFFALGKDF